MTLTTLKFLCNSLNCWDICSKLASEWTWDRSRVFGCFLLYPRTMSWVSLPDKLLHWPAVLLSSSMCCLAGWCVVLESTPCEKQKFLNSLSRKWIWTHHAWTRTLQKIEFFDAMRCYQRSRRFNSWVIWPSKSLCCLMVVQNFWHVAEQQCLQIYVDWVWGAEKMWLEALCPRTVSSLSCNSRCHNEKPF